MKFSLCKHLDVVSSILAYHKRWICEHNNIISTSVYLWLDNHGQLTSIIVFSGNKFTYIGKGSIQHHFLTYRIAGNFWGRKFLWNCRSFVVIRESFLREIWGCGILWHGNPRKFSLWKSFFTNSQKFSPSKVSRYAVIELWLFYWCQFFRLEAVCTFLLA